MKKGLKTMNEKTMGAIPVSALERLEQSAVKLSLITFCLRHEELKAAPDAAEIHSIKSDLSRALQEVSANATACALSGGIRKRQRQAPLRGQSLSVSSGKKSTRARPTVSCACVARNAATYLAASCGNPAPA